MPELVARLKLPDGLRATGFKEVSSLIDTETALGNYIASRFNGMVISDKDAHRNKGTIAFLAKPPAERVICGQFDDVQSTLNALSAKEHKKNALPVVHVAMPSGFGFADGEAYRDIELNGTISGADGEIKAVVYKTFIRSSATINVLAEDKPTAYAIGSALATEFRFNVSLGSSRFSATSKLLNVPITLNCEIEMAKSISLEPNSLPFNESRIWGLTAMVDVISEMYLAVEVKPTPARLELYAGGVLS